MAQKKATDVFELPAKIEHDLNTRRYKEMCSVALTALSYIDLERLDNKQRALYADVVNNMRRLKMGFEYT